MKGRLLTGLGVLALAAAGATLAVAATSDSTTTIDACVAKNGKVSIYASGQSCLASERKVSWNIQGPAGPPGPPGLVGTIPGVIDGMITITGQGFGAPTAIEGYTHEVGTPYDAASGLATGKRQHKPLSITKEIDSTTPLLMQAQFTNQTLPAVQLTLDDANGKAEATVALTNAHVVDNVQTGGYQTVSFTYQKITWTWIDGGNTASDDWDSQTSG